MEGSYKLSVSRAEEKRGDEVVRQYLPNHPHTTKVVEAFDKFQLLTQGSAVRCGYFHIT